MFPAIILLFQFAPALYGQESNEQTGPVVSVERLSGGVVVGELMAVGKDALVVRHDPNDSLVLPWSGIRRITGGTNSHPWAWAAGGVVAGALAGVIIGRPEDVFTYSSPYGSASSGDNSDKRVQDAAILGAAGGVVFGLGAALFDSQFEYDLQSMSDQELLVAREELNAQAHYPDADSRTFANAPEKKDAWMPPAEPSAEDGLSDIDHNIPKTSSSRRDAIAVVIGNARYMKSQIPSVDFACRDAMLVREHLISMFGYREGNIIYAENATQADFNAIFGTASNFKGKLYNYIKEGKSDVFIYYSGHGAPNPESKEGYFVPVDCDPALVSLNGYSLKTFYDNLSKLRYRSLTVVIDACFSGSSEKGMLLRNISPVFIEVEDPVLTLKKAVVLTSAGGNQVSSWYPEKGHSLFTYYFLKGMRGDADRSHDRTITVGEMKSYLTENVKYMARRLSSREQTPQVYGNPDRPVINVP
jgi:hypothetical protein